MLKQLIKIAEDHGFQYSIEFGVFHVALVYNTPAGGCITDYVPARSVSELMALLGY